MPEGEGELNGCSFLVFADDVQSVDDAGEVLCGGRVGLAGRSARLREVTAMVGVWYVRIGDGLDWVRVVV